MVDYNFHQEISEVWIILLTVSSVSTKGFLIIYASIVRIHAVISTCQAKSFDRFGKSNVFEETDTSNMDFIVGSQLMTKVELRFKSYKRFWRAPFSASQEKMKFNWLFPTFYVLLQQDLESEHVASIARSSTSLESNYG